MDLEDFMAGMFGIVVGGAYLALLIGTALFFVSIGVWPVIVWGWFTVAVVGSAIGVVASTS